uniref:Peptidase S1 domain-containing protein n=1 Tax=Gongylonema pulchrum TaxID=637853 RepID=A0A183E770_9BILA
LATRSVLLVTLLALMAVRILNVITAILAVFVYCDAHAHFPIYRASSASFEHHLSIGRTILYWKVVRHCGQAQIRDVHRTVILATHCNRVALSRSKNCWKELSISRIAFVLLQRNPE